MQIDPSYLTASVNPSATFILLHVTIYWYISDLVMDYLMNNCNKDCQNCKMWNCQHWRNLNGTQDKTDEIRRN